MATLLALLSFVTTQVNAQCAPQPVPLRIGNVSLSNGKVARGVEISIGNPEQTFAFMPQVEQNGTLLYSGNSCSDYSVQGCTSFRGGSYDQLASKTRKPSTLDTFPVSNGWPSVDPVTDTMKLTSNIALDNYQMGIAQSDWGSQGYAALMGFGLGTNSTILRTLLESKMIASRTWSFFWGQGFGMRSQMDGSLVFGGYDRAKTTGARFTEKMTPDIRGCSSQLVVQITDLTLNFVNGTNVSLFSPSTNSRVVIPTCLNPTLPVMMQLPLKPWFNNWMIATNHSIDDMRNSLGYYWWNMRYLPEDKPYDGALSITLSSGLEIRIENDQLITPDVTIDKQTGNTVTDSAGPVMLVTSMQEINENDTAQLGFQFFSAAYLQVNQEAEQFSLWKASRTEDEDLVALDAADEEVSEICAGNSTGTSVDNVSNDSTSLPKGAIAGIAVGGAAVVALVVGLVVWFWKKKKKSKDPKVMLPSARSQDHTTHESPYREMLIPAQNSV